MTDIYADSTGCNIEYVSGQESHTSTWAKFWVRGLDDWATPESDGVPESDKHSSYHGFVCLDIPEETVFTIFEQDGDKRGTDTYAFRICKASKKFSTITALYGGARHCTGNFEILVSGEGKTKAPRLFQWWLEYVGDKDANDRTNNQKLAFADHCAAHINKRGIKALPPMPEPAIVPATYEFPESYPVNCLLPTPAIAPPPLEPEPELEPEPGIVVSKKWVSLGAIVLDAGTQSRTANSESTIADYAEQMEDYRWQWSREPLPKLFFDGEKHYPGDGHHRIAAADRAGFDEILAEVVPGNLRDAVFYSLSANRFHGLQRTNADKRNQVEIALRDEEWAQMSDRAIAEHCGVSAPTVGKVRAELAEQGTVNVSSERVDKRGRKMETAAIGTKPKAEKGRREDGSIDRRTSAARSTTTPAPAPEPETTPAETEVSAPESEKAPDWVLAIGQICQQHGAIAVAMKALDECNLEEIKVIFQDLQTNLEALDEEV